MKTKVGRRELLSAAVAGSALLVPGANALGAQTERGIVGRLAPALDVDF